MILSQNYRFWQIGPNTEICSDFYEIWHSQQLQHANYEYNARQCLERSRDYWLKMLIGSEWLGCKIWLAVRTWLIALAPVWDLVWDCLNLRLDSYTEGN